VFVVDSFSLDAKIKIRVFIIIHDESKRIVDVLIGSIYRSDEIITGWYVFSLTVRGKLSLTRVIIIEVFPTPLKNTKLERFTIS
jgi:hypothetical protein